MHRSRSRVALVLALLTARLLAAEPACAAPAGTFDYYLFEQTWLPEFCTGTVARTPTQMPHPECRDLETRFGATHPTVHGLWPQNGDGDYPTTCDGSPGCESGRACALDDRRRDDDLARDLADKWRPG